MHFPPRTRELEMAPRVKSSLFNGFCSRDSSDSGNALDNFDLRSTPSETNTRGQKAVAIGEKSLDQCHSSTTLQIE